MYYNYIRKGEYQYTAHPKIKKIECFITILCWYTCTGKTPQLGNNLRVTTRVYSILLELSNDDFIFKLHLNYMDLGIFLKLL